MDSTLVLGRRVLHSRTMPIASPTRRPGDYLRLEFFICDEYQALATSGRTLYTVARGRLL